MAVKKYKERIDVYNAVMIRERDLPATNLVDLQRTLFAIAQKADPMCREEHCTVVVETDYDYENTQTYFQLRINRPETDEEQEKRIKMYEASLALTRANQSRQRKERKSLEYAEYLRLKAKFEK